MKSSSGLISWSVIAWLLSCGCGGGDKFFAQSGDAHASEPSVGGGSSGDGGAGENGPVGGADSGAANALDGPTGGAGEAGTPLQDLAGLGGGGSSGSDGQNDGGSLASAGVSASLGQSGSSSVVGCSPTCCGSALSASAVADSVKGFSATQGSCGWSYGYLLAGALPFVRLTTYNTVLFDTPAWVTSDKQPPWTATLATIQHPNGDPAQWNDRRWTSTVAGTVSIQGHVAKSDPTGGDGIIAHIRAAGVELWSAPIAYSDLVGKDFDIKASVKVGTQIEFLVDAGMNDKHDTTTLTAVITL